VARIKKRSITLYALLLALSYTPLSYASQQTRASGLATTHMSKASKDEAKVTKHHSKKTQSKHPTKHSHSATTASTAQGKRSTHHGNKKRHIDQTALVDTRGEKCIKRKGYKQHCVPTASDKPQTISQAHKLRVQKAQKIAMNKLMEQLGKPYRWGGSSPMTGFDCSGLIYYAYKDIVKFRIPRTANEMFHLQDAAAVNRSELERGDLVFFRTQGRGTADHVGVYVGNGKFIQSPRTGRDIQITSLSEDYWQRHYVGARRVMTPKTVR